MFNNIIPQNNKENGQTLLETTVGILIMVMGVSSAIGLAIYSLGSSTTIVKQTVGMGLAREGMEAARNMRDTNWLKGSLSGNCWNYQTNKLTATCYPGWLNTFYNLSQASGTFTLQINQAAADSVNYWTLAPETTNFSLYYNANASGGSLYTPVSTGLPVSEYSRKIIITQENPAYFTATIGPRLKVRVQVWWVDKDCPFSTTFPTRGKCGVELNTYLTNWRNY